MGEIPMFGDPRKAGRERRVVGQAITDLISRARKVGVSDQELTQARYRSYGKTDVEAEFVNQVQSLMMAHGGSTSVDIVPAMNRLTAALEESNRLERANQKTPASIPVGPPSSAPLR